MSEMFPILATSLAASIEAVEHSCWIDTCARSWEPLSGRPYPGDFDSTSPSAAATSAGWVPLHRMLPGFARVFITIRGPQVHRDSKESEPLSRFPQKGSRGGKFPPPRCTSAQPKPLARPMLRLPQQEGLPPLGYPPIGLSRCVASRCSAPSAGDCARGKELRMAATSALTFATFS